MKFKIGDVVALKSGGCNMTVEALDADSVTCVWYDGKKVHKRVFVPATLTSGPTVDEEEKKPKRS